MNKTSKIAIFSAILATGTVGAFALASVTYAQGFEPLTNVPGIFQQGTPTDPIKLLRGLYGLAMGIGAVIAVVMIILSGFKYMYEESIFGKGEAKAQIINAFAGLALILGSYIILRTINQDLVNFNLALPGGSGRIGSLIASQEATDIELKRQLNLLANEVAAARSEAEQAKGHLDQLSTQLTAWQKDYETTCKTINSSNERLCESMKTSIDGAVAAKKTAEETYYKAAITASTKAAYGFSGIALDNKISQKIVQELSGGGQKGTAAPNQIFSEHAKNNIERSIQLLEQEGRKLESLPEREDVNQELIKVSDMIATAQTSKAFYERAAAIDIYAGGKAVDGSKLTEAAAQLSNIYYEANKNAGDNQAVKAQIEKDYKNTLNAMKLYVNGPNGNKACAETANQENILCKN